MSQSIMTRTPYPFAIDSHLNVRVDAQMRNLGDIRNALHVSGVATRSEDASNLGVRINIM